MLHATCTQGNRVDSWLLVVGRQIPNLTLDPSFGHNLCFRCLNGSCKPILDIYVSIAFQWYKELFKPFGFDLCNYSLNIRDSTSQSWSSFGSVRVHSLTLSFTFRLLSWLTTLQALALVASPKLGLRHWIFEVGKSDENKRRQDYVKYENMLD